ncbi:hypothetical protein STEG23_036234 [Scotinomys teguina]
MEGHTDLDKNRCDTEKKEQPSPLQVLRHQHIQQCLEVTQERVINTEVHGYLMSGPPGLASLLPVPQSGKALLTVWRPLVASRLMEPALVTSKLCCCLHIFSSHL